MNFAVIHALVVRYLVLYTRNWIRSIEIIFWPMMDLLVWGFLTLYIQQQTTGEFPQIIQFLIGAMIFWDVLFRSQQSVAVSFLEDVWTRNLLNIFVAPIRVYEYIIATCVVGFVRISVIVTILTLTSLALYAFNLMDLGWYLLPFFANLLIFGWSLGIFTTALIIRWGQAAEALAWAIPFFIQPVVAVFYPVSVLPDWVQPISWIIPCTYAFEGMREILSGNGFSWPFFFKALGLNGVFLVLCSAFFGWMFRSARNRGLLTRIGSQ